ncbi:carbohydrate kinase family protein [Cellulomonas rhizosphaerae]|uniref:Carbohydrate kinase family protein n=1 Tax=Cellulomonas rhizosphaerae TaxID=2293719 RepID=A0A413RHG4_9CELL|nr:carbohydrate kinase family protein [Cellulomonas rhizosphaerae]RHA37575.1 carbohydrate kinase family protein [Cellulomonas rhizosphaerae]
MANVLVNGAAAWNTLVRVPSLPEPRSHMLFASGHHDGLGGTSAGKAVTLAALGVDVTLATLLGSDAPADLVREALTHPRLTVLASPARDGRTERHVNLMADDGSRVSIYLELPASTGTPPEVLAALDSASVAVLDLADSSLPLLAAARSRGVPVWCDVHDDDGTGEYARPFADAADVLLVSADRLADPRAYLRSRVDAGCRLAICTDGARGAIALDADGWWSVGTAPVETVADTNGAGDAFFAGLLSGTLDGLGTGGALARASATGALAVATTDLGAPRATAAEADALARSVVVRRD